jgi:hypothetical protein
MAVLLGTLLAFGWTLSSNPSMAQRKLVGSEEFQEGAFSAKIH